MVNLSRVSKLQPNWNTQRLFMYHGCLLHVNHSKWHQIHSFYSWNFHPCTSHFQHFRYRTCCTNTDWQIPNPSYQLSTYQIKNKWYIPWGKCCHAFHEETDGIFRSRCMYIKEVTNWKLDHVMIILYSTKPFLQSTRNGNNSAWYHHLL